MRWNKLGLVFRVEKFNSWMTSHAQVPTVLNMGDTLRVFFSTRDQMGQSRIASLDVEARNPINIVNVNEEIVLDLGSPGCFDEHGVMPSCVISDPLASGNIFLYYSGWSRRLGVPYSNLAGLAVSTDGTRFSRLGPGPILSTTIYEPYSATSPFVFTKDAELKILYSSGISWKNFDGKLEHTYDLKVATSSDGIHWDQRSVVCLEQRHPEEALTRPTILEIGETSHMWFCFRGSRDFRGGGDSYRIGYARSFDGINWERSDAQAGITISQTGWDSQMIAYPYVLQTKYGIYMFYNGNGFGTSGFGVAVLE